MEVPLPAARWFSPPLVEVRKSPRLIEKEEEEKKKKRQKNACDEEDGVRIKKKGAELHKNPWAIGLVQFVNLNF